MATDPARVPPHAAHVPRVLFERIARDPASAGRPHAFTADAAVVAVDICGYVPMTARAMLGVLRRERSVVRPERLRGSFGSFHQMKGEVGVEISALLAFAAVNNNDRVGLII